MSPGRQALSSVVKLRCCLIILYTCIVPVLSEDKYCPPITLGEGSPLFPQRTKGGNITMYRILHTDTNPNLLNITWTRAPSGLSFSDGRYIIDNVLSNGTVRATITLWNLTLIPDIGSYTVTVCSNCTCNKTTFLLEIYQCDPSALPQPVDQYTRTITAESSSSGVLYLYTLFYGSTDSFFYMTYWRHDGIDVCMEDATQDPTKFSCNRTLYGNCTFTANLYLFDPRSNYSGNYTVQAVGGDRASRNATVHIDILDEPRIKSCQSGPVYTDHSGRAQFMCQLSNYSEYAKVVVVEGSHTTYNKSTKELSFACWPKTSDPSLATCTVNISTSLHSGKLQYKLCVGYNASVQHHTGLQCSDEITISITSSNHAADNWSHLTVGLVIGGGVLVLVVLILIFVAVGFIVHRRRKRIVLVGLNETSPLLKPGSTPQNHKRSSTDTALWKTVRSGILEKDELVHIATVIDAQWPVIARYLGVSDTVIVTIKQRYSSDCKAQSFQMLLKWFQEQPTLPTRQGLVRIIEENMQDPVLTQGIVNILGSK